MKINRNNYEAFFIDYLEGILDEKLVDDFIEFLQQNPDLKEELSLFQTVSIEQEEIKFNKKELLLKDQFDVERVFNKAAIARLEGDITATEKVEFESYLKTHPEKQKEAGLFELTKLQPDESVVSNKKQKIYHHSLGKTVLLWSIRVAAVFIVALSVYFFIDKSAELKNIERQVATVEKEPERKGNSEETKEIPVKTNKKEVQPAVKKETVKQVIKKEKAKSEPTKSLRENSKGRLENNDLALIHAIEEIPNKIESIDPLVFTGIPDVDLVSVKITIPEIVDPMEDERLFVDFVKEKTGIEKLTLNIITKAGLTLVTNISKEKFNYETDNEGNVTEVNFDSRLLAFSFPTRVEEQGE